MGFGDLSVVAQQGFQIPGGARMEAGCWTKGSTTSICIPTTFGSLLTAVFCFSGIVHGALTSEICISGNNLVCATTSTDLNGVATTYIALGW